MNTYRDQGAAHAAGVCSKLAAVKSSAEVSEIHRVESARFSRTVRALDGTDDDVGQFLAGFVATFNATISLVLAPAQGRA
jgi:hypothetical protein